MSRDPCDRLASWFGYDDVLTEGWSLLAHSPREFPNDRAAGAEGLLIALAPAPLVFVGSLDIIDDPWTAAAAVAASCLLLVAGFTVRRRPRLAGLTAMIGLLGAITPVLAELAASPQLALLAWSAVVLIVFAMTRSGGDTVAVQQQRPRLQSVSERSRWAAASTAGFFCLMAVTGPPRTALTITAMLLSLGIACSLALHWAWLSRRSSGRSMRVWAALTLSLMTVPIVAGAALFHWFYPAGAVLAAGLLLIISSREPGRAVAPWWDPLVTHPARLLLTTFFCLCAGGTIALLLPGTTRSGEIMFADAIFTAVSATCVTGLIVLDTPNDFTPFGQICILVLIQLGGLGIMTISTVALHTLGRRLSMRQERLLITLHGEHGLSLVESLKQVLRVTLIVECLGVVAFLPQFLLAGDEWGEAVWRAVFTSVSAFCNAGFALQSDSLMSYADQPLVLHVAAALIVTGGMAPAIALAILNRARGRAKLDPAARIVLWMTALLLIIGTAAVLTFEWSNTLAQMPPLQRLHNAWFQSVTLRTAGFNSIEIAQISSPTFLIMIVFMFIGGSPGGTAGGVKTTTIAVLALAMWTSVIGRRDVITHRRRLPSAVVYRAIAIIGAGVALWIVTILALLVTQPIAERDLIFEGTSAIGTVGLSTGATGALDEVGRAIIIVAMFLGRVGPLTLFTLLGGESEQVTAKYPEGRVPLT